MADNNEYWGRSTLAVRSFHKINEATGVVVPGIEPSNTFARRSDYELLCATSYARNSNPTARIVEEVLAAIEGATDALAFNAGMAATTCARTRRSWDVHRSFVSVQFAKERLAGLIDDVGMPARLDEVDAQFVAGFAGALVRRFLLISQRPESGLRTQPDVRDKRGPASRNRSFPSGL